MLCHGIKWIPNIWELLHAGDLHMPWPKIIRKRIMILIVILLSSSGSQTLLNPVKSINIKNLILTRKQYEKSPRLFRK